MSHIVPSGAFSLRKLTVYPGAYSMSVEGPGASPLPSVRGDVLGWSRGAAMRNKEFLFSVDVSRLSSFALMSVTLTVPKLVPSPSEWREGFESWRRSIYRDAVAGHWCVEWQERGAPHVHAFLLWDCSPYVMPKISGRILEYWPWKDTQYDIQPSYDVNTWLKYLAKHVSRGVDHYQRCSTVGRWGRMWGHFGPLPTVEPKVYYLSRSDAASVLRVQRNLSRSEGSTWTPFVNRGMSTWSNTNWLFRLSLVDALTGEILRS